MTTLTEAEARQIDYAAADERAASFLTDVQFIEADRNIARAYQKIRQSHLSLFDAEPTINLITSDRGFKRGEFRDHNNEKCSIQESSLATEDCLWLGADPNRMHLTRAQVQELLPMLSCFAYSGKLP